MELLRDRRAEFDEAGVRVFGVSRDSPWTHIAWSQTLGLNFDLLSDFNADAVHALYVAAGLVAVAHIGRLDSEFLAWGAPRDGVTPGDHLQAAYNLWLPGHQLEHGDAPWRDPYSFQPEADPRTNFAGWPFGIVFWPLHALLGTVGAWNVFVVLTYVGAGALAALWLRALGLSRVVSIAGGLAFALAPYRSAQTAGG